MLYTKSVYNQAYVEISISQNLAGLCGWGGEWGGGTVHEILRMEGLGETEEMV